MRNQITASSATKRNLTVRVDDDKKSRLKELANASQMSMEGYCSAVISEAIRNGDLFEYIKRKVESQPALSS